MYSSHARTHETISTEEMNKHSTSQGDLGHIAYQPVMPAFFLKGFLSIKSMSSAFQMSCYTGGGRVSEGPLMP